jgi:hypothetical protein
MKIFRVKTIWYLKENQLFLLIPHPDKEVDVARFNQFKKI